MNSDLIAVKFSTELDGLKVKDALELMRGSHFIGAMNAVLVTRNREGKILVHFQRQSLLDQADHSCQASSKFAKALLDQPQEQDLQKLIDAGLDDVFVEKLVSSFVPDSSLILTYIRADSLIDAQQFLAATKQFRGTVYQTTVPDEVEAAIDDIR